MSEKKKINRNEEDDITNKLPSSYRRNCDSNGINVHKAIKEKLELAVEEGSLSLLQLWQPVGCIQIRSLMDTLIDLKYPHLRKLRLWKCNIEDEGVRSICTYVEKCNTVQYLDLMDNHITQLGCSFIAKSINLQHCKINKLILDNNPICNEGLTALTIGLRSNAYIQKLSLNYCEIDQNGVKYIQEILANIHCILRTLKLQGNPLKNSGVYEVLRAVNRCGNKLQKLILNDVHLNMLKYDESTMTENDKITKQLLCILQNNTSIRKYGFRNNWIPDETIEQMLETIRNNKNIYIVDMPDCMAYSLKELHAEIMKKRKPKKKKKQNNKKNNK